MQDKQYNEMLYKIALTLLPGVGGVGARKLLAHTKSAEGVFREKKSTLAKIQGIRESNLEVFNDTSEYIIRAEEELEFIEKHNIKPYFLTDDDYPYRLKQCSDSPLMIYTTGNADLNSKYVLSVVGTRKATEYGREMCDKIIKGLADLGVLIVSGLAYGVDTAAHKCAIDASLPTVGVLAHGLDRIYPFANVQLAQQMNENGGLITEYVSKTEPDRENFPMRNRIIAGLADATIVIEASSKGGALITADISNSYNRDVFAVPGRIGDTYSEGCNNLIKTNRAALLQKAEDIMYIMGWDSKPIKPQPVQRKLFINLNPEQESLIKILEQDGECSIDHLSVKSTLSPSKVANALLSLEFEGLIKTLPGKIYKILN